MKSATSSTSRKRISTEDALALWREYKTTQDLQVRNRLVMTFAPLVKYIVFKKVRELPARCEVEDFISCGLEALIASIDRYDPEKGATLEQFAWTRIHGAVLDELRRQDWAPRSLRRWERDIARVREQFTGIHGRRPTREELADSLSVTVEELRRREDDISVSDITSLNTLVVSDDETTVERIDTLAGTEIDADPERAALTTEAKAKFRVAFDTAPAPRARGRRPALRQEPHAARDRRHPRRLREPRLPDPLAAQAHAEGPAVRGRAPLLGRRLDSSLSSSREGVRSAAGMDLRIGHLNFTPPPVSSPERVSTTAGTSRFESPRVELPAAVVTELPPTPPPEAVAMVDRASQRAEELWRDQRELHFEMDKDSGRVIVQVRDLEGRVIRTIPPSEALDVLSGKAL